MQPPFVLLDGAGPILATAIHAGHELRPEISSLLAVDEATRLREEDPYTDRLTEPLPGRIVAHRSRFEVDLNRPRDLCVYLTPEAAWGLKVWASPPSEATVEASRQIHDHFYTMVRRHLDQLAQSGPFAVLDIHSYNHRRDGPDAPQAPIVQNPDVNVGTGSLVRSDWEALVDRVKTDLAAALPGRTVAENLRFKGGFFSKWVNERYEKRGCAIAIEFKKTFMDEWNGTVDERRILDLRDAVAKVVPGLASVLGRS